MSLIQDLLQDKELVLWYVQMMIFKLAGNEFDDFKGKKNALFRSVLDC